MKPTTSKQEQVKVSHPEIYALVMAVREIFGPVVLKIRKRGK